MSNALHKQRSDMNSIEFSICLTDSICAVALDMSLTRREFISYRVLSETKNISILRSKNIEQSKIAYRQRFASKPYVSQSLNNLGI